MTNASTRLRALLARAEMAIPPGADEWDSLRRGEIAHVR